MYARAAFVGVVVAHFASGSALAGSFVIGDRSFFNAVPHTLIDFESWSDGAPIDLDFNEFVLLAGDEYAPLGVRFAFEDRIAIFKSGSPSDRDALRIGGSLDNMLAFGTLTPGTPFEILFDTPVRAAGFFALTVVTLTAPEFEAFNAAGDSLGTFGLFGDLIDGVVANHVVFGYIGIASDEPIARIALSNGALGWGIDDLRFSSIPAPAGALVVLGAGGMLALRRRR